MINPGFSQVETPDRQSVRGLKVREYAHSADKRRQNKNYKKDLCLLIKLSLKN
jgi:hypothetical protein